MKDHLFLTIKLLFELGQQIVLFVHSCSYQERYRGHFAENASIKRGGGTEDELCMT